METATTTTPTIPRPARCLTPVAGDGWAVRDCVVSEADLQEVSAQYNIRIFEIRAPLSSIPSAALANFMAIHGGNIRHLNLQNSKISGDELLGMASKLPLLSSISFQYLHDITSTKLLDFMAKCSNLVSVKICQCSQIRADALLGILALDRNFTEITIDVYGTERMPIKHDYRPVAAVTSLSLGGLAFHGEHLELATKINGLNKLTLTMTGSKVDDFATLNWNSLRGKRGLQTIEIREFSTRKLKEIESHCVKEGIRHSSEHNKVIIELNLRSPSPLVTLAKEESERNAKRSARHLERR